MVAGVAALALLLMCLIIVLVCQKVKAKVSKAQTCKDDKISKQAENLSQDLSAATINEESSPPYYSRIDNETSQVPRSYASYENMEYQPNNYEDIANLTDAHW